MSSNSINPAAGRWVTPIVMATIVAVIAVDHILFQDRSALPPLHLGVALAFVLWGGWKAILPVTLAIGFVPWLLLAVGWMAATPIAASFVKDATAPLATGLGLVLALLVRGRAGRRLVSGRVDIRETAWLLGCCGPVSLLPGIAAGVPAGIAEPMGIGLTGGLELVVGMSGIVAAAPLAVALLPATQTRLTYACHCERPIVPLSGFTTLVLLGIVPAWFGPGFMDWVSASNVLALAVLGGLALASGWLATAIGVLLLLGTAGLTASILDPGIARAFFSPAIELLPAAFVGVLAGGVAEAKFRDRRRLADRHDEITALVHATEAAFIRVDRAGWIRFANEAAARLLGRSTVEEGRTIHEAFGDRNCFRMRSLLQAPDPNRRTVTEMEIELPSPSGRIGHHQVLCTTTHDDAGGVAGHTLVILDLGRRKRIESARARHHRETVQSIAGAVIHDMNTLAMEVGSVAALARETETTPGTQQALGHIEHSCESIARRARRLRPFAGIRRAEGDSTDLSAVVDRRLDIAMSAGLLRRVERRLEPGLMTRIDHEFLEFMIDELIQNATDAAGPGVCLEVRTGQDAGNPGHGFLQFNDDGPGIDRRIRNRLGREFVTTKGRGRGLGLRSIARGLRHGGGMLRIRSLPKGTYITVVVPVDAAFHPSETRDDFDRGALSILD